MEEIKAQTNLNTKLLQALIRKVDSLAKSSEEVDMELDTSENPFPLKSREELLQVEQQLGNQEKMKTMLKTLSVIGGENLKLSVRRLLAYMFSNELAKNINWMGKRENWLSRSL